MRDRLENASLVLDGRPYECKNFQVSFEAIFGRISQHVLAMGPLHNNNEWYITFNTVEARNKILLSGTLQVKGKIFKYADRCARVHWAHVHSQQ